MAKQIVELEERIDGLEDGLGAIMRRLDEISRTLAESPAPGPGTVKEPR